MTAQKALTCAALAVCGTLLAGACSSNDASLGRNQGATNPGDEPDAGSGGSAVANTGGSMSKGSAGSANGSAGSASSGGSSAAGGYGGSTGPECEDVQCFRPIECVEECNGPVLKSSCCPCDPGTFDNFECNTSDAGVPELNTPCVEDMCPEGLTPVHFYGIAGPAGPEFCWCSIQCADDPTVCPAGTTCTSISDGPSDICYEF